MPEQQTIEEYIAGTYFNTTHESGNSARVLQLKMAQQGGIIMIGTMTDEQIKNKIEKYEGAQLLALFMALYHFHINEHKLKEEVYEMIKAKVINRLKGDFKNERD